VLSDGCFQNSLALNRWLKDKTSSTQPQFSQQQLAACTHFSFLTQLRQYSWYNTTCMISSVKCWFSLAQCVGERSSSSTVLLSDFLPSFKAWQDAAMGIYCHTNGNGTWCLPLPPLLLLLTPLLLHVVA
jgi:hypothetical protein